jgi:hypothetical protein
MQQKNNSIFIKLPSRAREMKFPSRRPTMASSVTTKEFDSGRKTVIRINITTSFHIPSTHYSLITALSDLLSILSTIKHMYLV